jgi:hypothetical protein
MATTTKETKEQVLEKQIKELLNIEDYPNISLKWNQPYSRTSYGCVTYTPALDLAILKKSAYGAAHALAFKITEFPGGCGTSFMYGYMYNDKTMLKEIRNAIMKLIFDFYGEWSSVMFANNPLYYPPKSNFLAEVGFVPMVSYPNGHPSHVNRNEVSLWLKILKDYKPTVPGSDSFTSYKKAGAVYSIEDSAVLISEGVVKKQ